MMETLNKIYKEHYGRNLTNEEAWKMVDLVKAILENADRNLENITKEQNR